MLTKETFRAMRGVRVDGVSDEIGAGATVSGDVKESVCNGELLRTDPHRNLIWNQDVTGAIKEDVNVLWLWREKTVVILVNIRTEV